MTYLVTVLDAIIVLSGAFFNIRGRIVGNKTVRQGSQDVM
jgi:hypothetical protein